MNGPQPLTVTESPADHGSSRLLSSEVHEETDASSHTSSSSSQDAASVVSVILRASHRLRTALADHFAELGLTDIRYAVLKHLRDASEEGCTQADLAECLSQSESSVCMLIRRMRNSELVYRLRSRTDQRKWTLNLTERGRQLLEQAETQHRKRMSELLAAFSSEQLSQLTELLQHLVEQLESAEPSKPAVQEESPVTSPDLEKETSPKEQYRPAA